MSNDQYEYPNQEDKQDFSNGPMSGMDSIRSILKNKRIMMSFGMIFGVYILTNVLAWVLSKDKKEVPAPQVQVQAPAQPVIQPPADNVEAQERDEQLNTRLSELKHTVSQANTQNAQVKHEMEEMESHYQTLLGNVHEMYVAISSINGQLADINQRVFKLEKRLAPKKVKKVVKKVALRHYHLRAVVYGRAWLADKQGQSFTVKLGDSVPTYGSVQRIDARAGVVTTSSGRVITFNN